MHRRTTALVTTLVLLIPLVATIPAAASTTTGQQSDEGRTPQADPAIRFDAYEFRPSRGETADTPPGLTISGYARGQRGVYLIQFGGPVQQAWKDAVEAEGAELLDYIPDFAFQARMNPAQADRVDGLEQVVWVGPYQPAFKLPAGVTSSTEEELWRVSLFRGANSGRARAAVARSGATVVRSDPAGLLILADGEQLQEVAHVTEVEWAEPFTQPQLHNEYGAGQIIGGAGAAANGYDGSGQTVAVADTGLGGGTPSTAHADVPATRITAMENWPGANDSCWTVTDDGPQDVSSGHGTHTALSVLSDGGPGGEGIGTAPAADLVFQAVENWADWKGRCKGLAGSPDGYYLTGLTDLAGLYQQAYDHGARVHSNSWGSFNANACLQDYTANAVTTDDFINTHRDMTITFSAGNDGIDANSDGEVDDCSMGEPATAKNLIAVGASENDRQGDWACDTSLAHTNCSDLDGQNDIFTYGAAWPSDYPADPIASDPSVGNAEQMAAFSSRGPTTDGRIKPDVVAPGTWVLSGYSDLHQQGYDSSTNPKDGEWQYDGWGHPLNVAYKYSGGTSMSNPIVAGGAAVVRDHYDTEFGHNASAALVKATLVNSAVDLLDEDNDGVDDNVHPIPNHHEGWGRVDLEAATDGSHDWLDEPTFAATEFESEPLTTGGSHITSFEVAAFDQPFKATLVWTDAPGASSGTAVDLVNDLDLEVTAPDNTVYRGNDFIDGWSTTGGAWDNVNTVENVYVQSADAGTWTVEVAGYNVPSGPQPYALVVDYLDNAPPTVAVDNPLEGDTVTGPITVQIGASDLEDDPDGSLGALTAEWKLDDGPWQRAGFNPDSGKYEAYWDPTGVADGPHTITGHVTDSASNQAAAVSSFTLAVAPRARADFDGDGVSDVGVFRPSSGEWLVDGVGTVVHGSPGDVPVPGDYDGDGTTDVAVFGPDKGRWTVKDQFQTMWGRAGDIPVPADFDGDGSTDVAVFRPSEGRWLVQGQFAQRFGAPGDVPVPGDYDGDGAAELAVFRPASGQWLVSGQSVARWGQPGDVAVPADYDGDGTVDVAVFRPSSGRWLVRGQFDAVWGRQSGAVPVPANYGGDLSAELAVFRGDIGRWKIQGLPSAFRGRSGDIPLTAPPHLRHSIAADGDP